MNRLAGVVGLVAVIGCTSASAPKPLSRAEKRALKSEAATTYDAREFAKCGAAYEKLGDAYNAACCFALSGDRARAFAQLAVDAKTAEISAQQLETDPDLASLRTDSRWAEAMKTYESGRAAHLATLNELATLFAADQADRQGNNPDWNAIKPRDEAREQRVDEILAAGGAKTSADYFHAAMVFQHGGTPAQAQKAHDLALEAVKLDGNNDDARWLAAASLDRKLMYEKKPQRYGTQFHREGTGPWVLWEVDPTVTDAEREEWNVPPLEEARKRAARMNQPEGAP